MARIDSILTMVLQQGANELRVGSDREPKVLAHGTPKRFSMPATNEETLRDLLGDILSTERENVLRQRGRLELPYTTEAGAAFQVSLTWRPAGGVDAIFLRTTVRAAAAAASSPVTTVAPASVRLEVASASPIASAAPAVAVAAPSFQISFGDVELVQRAVAAGATDLHLAEGDAPMVRVDGRLLRLDDMPVGDLIALLGLDAAARDVVGRGASIELSADVDGERRARVHVFRSSTGIATAIRFLGRTPSSLSTLDLPVPLEDLVDLPHGLVLVTGATGSGKSTTLAALAQEALQRRSIVLVALEDPVEYVLGGGDRSIVRQRQVGRDVRDFASGLRDALREDPDVLVVGEMRDPETIALALTAAETGHLVLATLHSGSAASSIERIVDAYPSERQAQIRVQLADVLRVVVSQRLLPRARGGGRIPALEVLRINHAAGSLIREGKTAQLATVIQSGRREGMISLERCLADRVSAGEVRLEHARAAANDPDALATYLHR